jgi:hypothetical protein
VIARVAVAVALVAAAACAGDGERAPPGGLGEVLTTWMSAGVTVAVTDAEPPPFGARACKSGTAAGLPVTLCEFADEAAAQAAQPAGLKLVGEATGASLASGKLLLVVSDPAKVDPSGKQINTITAPFRKK